MTPLLLFALAIYGAATVTDGDTLRIGDDRIRLVGIDAPEIHQTCHADGALYDCGVVSAAALRAHIAGREVGCDPEGKDRYGRVLAVCYLGPEDLNAWMVKEGLAVAYRKYSEEYVPEEDAARKAAKGLWRGEFVMPWDWRKQER